MTDQQIVPGAGPTPVAITLDVAQRLLPKLAFASFDGTGAAGDFLPVVRFVGPGGAIAGQAVGDVVTAGASVDQTWFRGLAKKSGGSGVTAATEVATQGGFVSVPGDGTGNHPSLPWAHGSGAFLLDYTTPETPAVLADGVYAVAVWVIQSTPVFNHASVMTAKLRVGSSAALAAMSVLDTTVSGSGLGVATPEISLTMPPVFMAAGETLEVGVRQGSGVTLAFQFQQPAGAFITKLS